MLKSDIDLSDEAYLNRLRQSFPSVMNQQDDSNNQKIINIFSGIENYYKNQLLEMNKLNVLENVKGQMLTLLAKDWGINRVDDDDEFLRFQIRFAMWKMHLGIGINEIKQFISFIMDIEPQDFQIVSTGIEDIEVNNIPFNFSRNEHSDLKTKLLIRAIESILPTEWNLTNVQFSKRAFSQLYYGIVFTKGYIRQAFQKTFNYNRLTNVKLYQGLEVDEVQMKEIIQKPFKYGRLTSTNVYQGISQNGFFFKSKHAEQKGAD